ncbi:hypothetical protein [Polyangium spumosum]|uniref:Uncharacterized protein n=1 Tax=Polyangium spumosum TaxID=889282 RepID=A0A6N7PY33_9BACT|nr:hypothetical protein [Polyangium spumosum]MRG95786.1 hypothetical protein [Polyangium spumosum]
MRRNVLLGLVISSGACLLAAGAGCSDGATTPPGSGGSGGGGGASQSSSSSSSVAQSGSGGMTPGDDNVSCDTAAELFLDDPGLQDTLDPIDTDEDFYKFKGMAGQAILISTDAKPPQDEFDNTYPDLVLTVYKKEGGQWVQIAENDDPFPRSSNDSSLYTILPASQDDEYCMRVTECNVWVGGAPGCAPSADITTYDYAIGAGVIDPSAESIADEKEPNDTAAEGTPIEYAKNPDSGNYFISLQWGGFSSATDVDIWSFNVPADAVMVMGDRPVCNFDFYPGGENGSGSTATTGLIAYVTTAADPLTKLAEIDVTLGQTPSQIAVPCQLGTDYLFFMTRAAGTAAGANDFYFVNHIGTGSNPLEAAVNDDVAMPEALKPTPNGTTTSYFVDGDIDMAPMDIDYFSVDVPSGAATVSVACGGHRSGSGLRGLKVSVLGANDMPIAGGVSTETAQNDLFIQDANIPAGVTSLKLKVEAASQDPNVTSTFYRCGVHVSPPAAP